MDPAIYWRPERSAALEALHDFTGRAGHDYARDRNEDRGPGAHRNVSRLSPWICSRVISEEEVVRAVLELHTPAASEKFIQEVCWRTYWKGWLALRPAIWQRHVNELEPMRSAFREHAGYQRAVSGTTGMACFDAFARELIDTGYLHNHARMWFASIWIFTLKLPWPLGADFFFRYLLDGDPASNTLSWRWVAGLQTKGKHYLARAENIERYTAGRFSGSMKLNEGAAPLEEAEDTPRPGKLHSLTKPQPGKRTGLLLTEEDVSAGTWLKEDVEIIAVAGMMPEQAYARCGIDERVTAFRQGCLHNAGAILLNGRDPAAAVWEWVKREKLEQVVMAEPGVGLWDDAMMDLTASGLPVRRVRRPWDEKLYPHATHGFFRFKSVFSGEKIFALL